MKIPYPEYRRYSSAHTHPSVLDQRFPTIDSSETERPFYPPDKDLAHLLEDERRERVFAAARFCGFLADTIAVEQDLVNPAIASVNKLPELGVPEYALEDLYHLVADEGHHAEQSLRLLNSIESAFGIVRFEERGAPLFMRRLGRALEAADSEQEEHLIRIVNGVVTETRISIELGKFAADSSLAEVVRDVCRSHQADEAIHASQFRALGIFLWECADETRRDTLARHFAQSAVARSLPDVRRLAFYLGQATDLSAARCRSEIEAVYTPQATLEIMRYSAKPTFALLKSLGITERDAFRVALCQAEEEVLQGNADEDAGPFVERY